MIITGSNLGQVASVTFGSDTASSFTVLSPTSIVGSRARPHDRHGGHSRERAPEASSGASSKDHFTYEGPTITGISATGGPAGGGTAQSVAGTGFSVIPGATAFAFGKAAGTSVSCSSTSQCSVVSPAGKVGTVDIVATVAGKKSPKSASDRFTYH